MGGRATTTTELGRSARAMASSTAGSRSGVGAHLDGARRRSVRSSSPRLPKEMRSTPTTVSTLQLEAGMASGWARGATQTSHVMGAEAQTSSVQRGLGARIHTAPKHSRCRAFERRHSLRNRQLYYRIQMQPAACIEAGWTWIVWIHVSPHRASMWVAQHMARRVSIMVQCTALGHSQSAQT